MPSCLRLISSDRSTTDQSPSSKAVSTSFLVSPLIYLDISDFASLTISSLLLTRAILSADFLSSSGFLLKETFVADFRGISLSGVLIFLRILTFLGTLTFLEILSFAIFLGVWTFCFPFVLLTCLRVLTFCFSFVLLF